MAVYSVNRETGAAWDGRVIGILTLDERIPRVPGSVGNAETFPYPVRYGKIKGATVERLVIAHDKSMESLFVAAARDLQDEGVCAVVGCCGFMALFQKSVASAIKVPALLSSVMQLPIIISSISPDKRVGVITANSLSLTSELLDAAGIGEVFSRLCIRGLEDKPEARGALLEERGSLNDAVIRDEVLDTVGAMLRETSDIGAILLECSELPPYARYVQKLTGLPVFDFVTMIDYLRSGLAHRLYINQRRRSVCSNVLRSSSLGFV